MKFRSNVLLLLSLFVFLTLAVQAVPQPEFRFPAKEYLKTKISNAEIIAAIQIPEDILERMPTSALVKSCLEYPLYPDIVLYNTPEQGIDALVAQFNGLQELMKRKDAGAELLNIYCRTHPQDVDGSWTSREIGRFTVRISYLELLLAREPVLNRLNPEQRAALLEESVRKLESKLNRPDIFGTMSIKASTEAGFRLMDFEKIEKPTGRSELGPGRRLKELYEETLANESSPSGQITTPCGEDVPGYISPGAGVLSVHEQDFIQSYIPDNYPSATEVGPADPDYNCHGYAWHMSRYSTLGPWSEKVSIQTTQPKDYYVTDGSYKTGGSTAVISYSIDHSAIPEGTGGGEYPMSADAAMGTQYYISKWGTGPLVRHLPTDVPSGYGTPQGYYSIAPPHTVTIGGTSSMASGEQYTFTSQVRNGCIATPQYQWAYRIGSGSYINLGTSSSQSFTMGTSDVTLRLRVQKGAKVVYDYHTITYDSELSVTIFGPTYMSQGQSFNFEARITGGSGTVTSVSWWAKFAVGFSNSHNVIQPITMGTRNVYLTVTVVKGGQTVYASKTVNYTLYSPERP